MCQYIWLGRKHNRGVKVCAEILHGYMYLFSKSELLPLLSRKPPLSTDFLDSPRKQFYYNMYQSSFAE